LVLPPDIRPTYVALARATADIAVRAGRLDADTADRLRLVLVDQASGRGDR
jgi:hypothetical protein